MPKAKNLKYLRKQCSLTQQTFADAIGATKATVISWESKKRAIPVPTARRISRFFGVSYEEFCDIDIELRDQSLVIDADHPTYDEMQQLLKFRKISDTSKEIIRAALDAAYHGENAGK